MKFLRIPFLQGTSFKQGTVPPQCLQTAKSLISSCRRTGETILRNYWQNPKITVTVHYFLYNSHHHYHYYHFHYHCKMHLYRLKILLTILFVIIWSPVCFNRILSSFYWYVLFLLSYYAFRLFTPNKSRQNYFTTIRYILDVLFIPLIYSHIYLHCLIYTHLLILIYTYLCSLNTIIWIW